MIIVSLVLVVIGVILGRYFEVMGQFVQLFSLGSFVSILLLNFLNTQIFQTWKKFVQIFIPILIVLVLLAPEYSNNNFGGVGYGFDKELTTWWLSSIFFVVSMIVIFRKYAVLRKDVK